jgi:hypothetical protein
MFLILFMNNQTINMILPIKTMIYQILFMKSLTKIMKKYFFNGTDLIT